MQAGLGVLVPVLGEGLPGGFFVCLFTQVDIHSCAQGIP